MESFLLKSIKLLSVIFIINQSLVLGQGKVLQSSRLLAEADFHFDTFYKIIDCGDGNPQIYITAFNESGRDLIISFDVQLRDKTNGITQDIKVPYFNIKSAELMAPSCAENKYTYLKYALKNKIDYSNMEVTVKFHTK